MSIEHIIPTVLSEDPMASPLHRSVYSRPTQSQQETSPFTAVNANQAQMVPPNRPCRQAMAEKPAPFIPSDLRRSRKASFRELADTSQYPNKTTPARTPFGMRAGMRGSVPRQVNSRYTLRRALRHDCPPRADEVVLTTRCRSPCDEVGYESHD